MTLEEIKEKFDPVWKQIQDFIPIEVSKEDLKDMMQVVPVEEVYVEALQLWALVKKTLNIGQATNDKEKELWVELKRLFESNVEDQLSRNIHAGGEGLPVEKGNCHYSSTIQKKKEFTGIDIK
nr:hypothetical protein [Tanacetum cinerariifolium]